MLYFFMDHNTVNSRARSHERVVYEQVHSVNTVVIPPTGEWLNIALRESRADSTTIGEFDTTDFT